jgi:hypothetical protein
MNNENEIDLAKENLIKLYLAIKMRKEEEVHT